MADYKVVDADALDSALDALAESIKTKSGVTGDLAFPAPNGFKEAVDRITAIINGTNPTTITSNGNHATGGYSHVDVNVQPSSDYIKKSDTWNYTTQFACGTYTPSADTLMSAVTINNIGFKPKVFFLRNNKAITTTSSRYYATTSISVADNNYKILGDVYPDGSTKSTVGFTAGLFYKSSQATSLQTNSVNNLLHPADNGVAGNGSSSATGYVKGGIQYFWFAWG